MQSTFVDVRGVGVFRLLERVLAVFRLSRRLEKCLAFVILAM